MHAGTRQLTPKSEVSGLYVTGSGGDCGKHSKLQLNIKIWKLGSNFVSSFLGDLYEKCIAFHRRH